MNTKQELIDSFNPNGVGSPHQIFGLPFDYETSELIIIPVPWEVTVSYNSGTANGPKAILKASSQVDLYLKDIPNAWKMGIHMMPIEDDLLKESNKYRELAKQYINWLESGESEWQTDELKVIPKAIDEVSEKLNIYVRSQAAKVITQGKIPAILGGDHSTSLGLINALSEHHSSFGILQIDAHADLRKGYENFTYSHASVMYNALQSKSVTKLVQVGLRDICEEEMTYTNNSNNRIIPFFDEDIKSNTLSGISWKTICNKIIDQLPDHIYISLDIDGLDPKLCPNTGTPVPGGLEFYEVILLIKMLVKTGRKIIGFDLNEVAPGNDDWDANVGARLLYHLSCLTGVSQRKLMITS